ncbi:uncharacterized protein LOC112094723 [Morus notabilis]|uniref:uncharacterized protein LOC112094723 n=1 Tax=Morus notabilis TaxID=981085 RepID=UPI000CED2C8E|nr:uncharacterized protein LOC112094723 [Morus notabilis]
MDDTKQYMAKTNTLLSSQATSIRNLEVQMGQLASSSSSRQQGSLPSDTIANPKEQCKAIFTRSGLQLQDPPMRSSIEKKHLTDKEYLKKNNLDHRFAKFLEVFKKFHINIPFAEALAQMPTYMKFMKDILSNKRKLENFETVTLTEECSAIIQRKLPPKLKDPDSFTIPCTIGNSYFGKALCDLGASINLMPLLVFQRLGLGELKATIVLLQMADRSIKYSRGILEDVLVKVDKLIFLTDFIVLDVEEDQDIPLILGRPFLATRNVVINVSKGELSLEVKNEKVTFNAFSPLKGPQGSETCCRMDNIKKTLCEKNSVKAPKQFKRQDKACEIPPKKEPDKASNGNVVIASQYYQGRMSKFEDPENEFPNPWLSSAPISTPFSPVFENDDDNGGEDI